jgi:hypothetical protein
MVCNFLIDLQNISITFMKSFKRRRVFEKRTKSGPTGNEESKIT